MPEVISCSTSAHSPQLYVQCYIKLTGKMSSEVQRDISWRKISMAIRWRQVSDEEEQLHARFAIFYYGVSLKSESPVIT